jgi:hypothetical protein
MSNNNLPIPVSNDNERATPDYDDPIIYPRGGGKKKTDDTGNMRSGLCSSKHDRCVADGGVVGGGGVLAVGDVVAVVVGQQRAGGGTQGPAAGEGGGDGPGAAGVVVLGNFADDPFGIEGGHAVEEALVVGFRVVGAGDARSARGWEVAPMVGQVRRAEDDGVLRPLAKELAEGCPQVGGVGGRLDHDRQEFHPRPEDLDEGQLHFQRVFVGVSEFVGNESAVGFEEGVSEGFVDLQLADRAGPRPGCVDRPAGSEAHVVSPEKDDSIDLLGGGGEGFAGECSQGARVDPAGVGDNAADEAGRQVRREGGFIKEGLGGHAAGVGRAGVEHVCTERGSSGHGIPHW